MSKQVQVIVTPDRIALHPGDSADVEVSIQNASPVVEHFSATVVGLPGTEMFGCEPEVVKLRPREAGNVRVKITLPERGGLVAGPYTLGILVRSPYQRDVSRCEELALDVQPAPALTMNAQPEMVTGGKVGNYALSLVNEGNLPLAVTLAGSDQENRVGFEIRPRELRLEPGMAGGATVTARTAPPLTGQDARRAITFRAHAGELVVERPVSFVQRPRIRGGLMKVGGLAAGLAVLAGATIGGAMLIRDAKESNNVAVTNSQTPQTQGPETNQQSTPPSTESTPPSAESTPPPSESVPPSSPPSSTPPVLDTSVFVDFSEDAQKTGERLISNDRYSANFGLLLDTPTEKAPPGCEDANAQALRVSRTLGVGGFLTSAKPTSATACQTMPLRFEFARPSRNVNLGFTGTGTNAEYQLVVQFADGQTQTLTSASAAPGAVVNLAFEDPTGRTIRSVTFWHANPDPTAKDPTLVKSLGFSPTA
jgi:hypothetical protein